MQKTGFLLLPILLLSILFNGCAHLPGAKEPSDAEINAEAAKAYAEVKAKSKISTNAEWNAIVQRVAKRIEGATNENFQWEAVLIESKEVNAWCMPGGKIAVYTGIMPVLKTEGALAAVLGHEVAHATLRHGKQQYARAIKANYAGIGIGLGTVIAGQLFCKNDLCKKATLAGGVLSGLAITFITHKYSRDDESQADEYGQKYMAKAGYDPAESVKLWERMSAAMGGKAPPEILSDHPSDEHRHERLTAELPSSEELYRQAPAHYGVGETISAK